MQANREIFKILPMFGPDVLLLTQDTPGITNIMTLAFIRHLTDPAALKVIVSDAHLAKVAKSFWKADVVLTNPLVEEDLLDAISFDQNTDSVE